MLPDSLFLEMSSPAQSNDFQDATRGESCTITDQQDLPERPFTT